MWQMAMYRMWNIPHRPMYNFCQGCVIMENIVIKIILVNIQITISSNDYLWDWKHDPFILHFAPKKHARKKMKWAIINNKRKCWNKWTNTIQNSDIWSFRRPGFSLPPVALHPSQRHAGRDQPPAGDEGRPREDPGPLLHHPDPGEGGSPRWGDEGVLSERLPGTGRTGRESAG